MTKSAKGLAKRAPHFRPIDGAIALCSPTVEPETLEALQVMAAHVSKMSSEEIKAAAAASELRRTFLPPSIPAQFRARKFKGSNLTPPKKKRKK